LRLGGRWQVAVMRQLRRCKQGRRKTRLEFAQAYRANVLARNAARR